MGFKTMDKTLTYNAVRRRVKATKTRVMLVKTNNSTQTQVTAFNTEAPLRTFNLKEATIIDIIKTRIIPSRSYFLILGIICANSFRTITHRRVTRWKPTWLTPV